MKHFLFFKQVIIVSLALCLLLPAQVAYAASAQHCSEQRIRVALGPGLPADQTVSGTLCTPPGQARDLHEVDLLVHGASYNRDYWDWPIDTSEYSYVERALRQGRATFAYDKLGSGTSSRPPSTLATMTTHTYVMHEIVQWLRTNGYSTVNAVGHSMGAGVAIQEAAHYQDVDRLIVTSTMHEINPEFAQDNFATTYYPAMLDPQFSGKLIDPGYLTMRPGTRSVFYYSTADAAVIAYDEAHKDVVSAGELSEGIAQLGVAPPNNVSNRVTAPVLLVVGDNDYLFCSKSLDCGSSEAVMSREAEYYSEAKSVSAYSIKDTGHNTMLHPSSKSAFQYINAWIERH